MQVRWSHAVGMGFGGARASGFGVADGAFGAQCIDLAKKRRADVFEKRKAIVIAVYKQDAAERQQRIVALKLKTDELDGVRSLAEHVARSRSARPARESVAQGCAIMACIGTLRAVCVDNGVRAAR